MIDRKYLLSEFQKLVSIDSESFHERKMADFLKGELATLGISAAEDDAGESFNGDAGNLFARIPAYLPADSSEEDMPEPVLISSHMDTVAPGNGRRALIGENGIIHSAGDTVLGADDHAGLAEILTALKVITEKKLYHPEIELLFAAAEEPFARGSGVFDFSKVHARRAYVLDLDGPVGGAALAAPAMVTLDIRVKGKSAHAGFAPEKGINAIQAAAAAISRLRMGRVDEDTTMNIGTIAGGTSKNIVAGSVAMTGEIRSMKDEKAREMVEKIQSIFEEEAVKIGAFARVDAVLNFHSYCIAKEEKVVKEYLAACIRAGVKPALTTTFGGSDNNHFAEHGIRGIVIACGMNNCHTAAEWTSLDEMERATRIVLELMRS